MSRPLGDLVVKLGEQVRRRPRLLSWVMLTAGVVIIGGAAWVGYRSYEAYHHLQEASAQVAVLQSQLSDISAIDPAATAVTVDRLQAEASAARSAVEDPIYGAAVAVPLIGPNLGALRVIAETVESLSTDVLPPLAEAAQGLDPADWAPTDGTIDLEPIERLSPLLQQADGAVHRALEHIAAIDRGAVIQPVGDAVTALQSKLGKAAEATVAGARITRLLPPMLGSAAPRTYLVAFQNSAELRATGGIFGSYAVVRADHGKITIVDQGPARNLGRFDPPAVELPANQKALYGDRMARFPADVNFGPDFPTAARLYLEMYRLRTGTTVDGVVAIDPVALSYALKGAAPIDVGDGISIDAGQCRIGLAVHRLPELRRGRSVRPRCLSGARERGGLREDDVRCREVLRTARRVAKGGRRTQTARLQHRRRRTGRRSARPSSQEF